MADGESRLGEILPRPDWLAAHFGIPWDGQYDDLGGAFAAVAEELGRFRPYWQALKAAL